MFYSNTFLARKGPLGTVWCAAHLQHKLKKSHYTSTDITLTVDRIMFPEVPIALRMSGHLLLGVVRIYSKKVDYLYQDYNVFLISLRKAFSSVEVNLPEDATHAPFSSVTLPDTFELDALNLDNLYNDGNEDTNLKSLDEITLSCDQIPTGRDPYITINFDEDFLRHSFSQDNVSGLRSGRVEGEDSPPEIENLREHIPETGNLCENVDSLRHSFSQDNVSGLRSGRVEGEVSPPEIEILRENVVLFPDPRNDILPSDTYIEQQINQDREHETPIVEDTLFAGEVPRSPQHPQVPLISPLSDHLDNVMFSNNSLGNLPLNLALKPSPVVDEPKGKSRKRKQRFDKDLVLTNVVLHAGLKNCNDIRRKRKICPSSDLDVWRSKNRVRKESIFSEPFITGLAENLRDIYCNDFISSKAHLGKAHEESNITQFSLLHKTIHSSEPRNNNHDEIEILRNANEEPNITQFSLLRETIHSSEPKNNNHDEIEILRNYEGSFDNYTLPDEMIRNNFNSHGEKYNATPSTGSSVSSTQKCPTREKSSSGTVPSDMGTPFTDMDFENPRLSVIPEDTGVDFQGLSFLASEDYTPTTFQRTEGFSTLSGTTRKVAQYLKEKYSPISEDLDRDLSLNQLLEGKPRKVCARMLFETLVLKCGGFVDVQQEEAYGDIKLTLTPKLFKDQS